MADTISMLVPPRQKAPTPLLPPHAHASGVRALPVGGLPVPVSTRDGSMVYGMGRLDDDGRISDRSVVTALGWQRGQRLDISVLAGSILIRPDETATFAMTGKPYVTLPAPTRRWCGLRGGDRVLLAAAVEHDLLIIHPQAALDAMILDYHTRVLAGGDTP